MAFKALERSPKKFGFKMNPFAMDRIDQDSFKEEKFDEIFWQTTEISNILSNTQNFQLVTGFPGTGKTVTLLYLRKMINDEFDGTLAVYFGDVSLILVSGDILDEKVHIRDISLNIVSKLWAEYISVIYERDEKELIDEFRHSEKWKKVKTWISKILSSSLKAILASKFGISFEDGDDSSHKEKPLSLNDVLEAVESIKSVSKGRIKKLVFLFDELGEYTKNFFNALSKKGEYNSKIIPYFYTYLKKLKDQKGILIKVAGYADAYQLFIDAGVEDSHLHWESLDPQFKTPNEYYDKLNDFGTLVRNMFLKRMEHFSIISPPLWELESSETKIFEDKTAVERISAFSNFNPRTALNLAENAFNAAIQDVKRGDLNFTTFKLEPEETWKGTLVKYDYIRDAIDYLGKKRSETAGLVLEKYLFGNKFFDRIVERGANYLIIPDILLSINETNAKNTRQCDFIEFFDYLKKTRIVLQYPNIVRNEDLLGRIFGISTCFIYNWLSKYRNTPDIKQLKIYNRKFENLYHKFIRLTAHKEIPEYFEVYPFNQDDVNALFVINDVMGELDEQIKILEKKKQGIDKKLMEDEALTEDEKVGLEMQLRGIREELRKLQKQLEAKQKGVEYVNPSTKDETINEFGQSETEEKLKVELSDEYGKFLTFFNAYPSLVQELAGTTYKIIKELDVDFGIKTQIDLSQSYVKILDEFGRWWILIKKIKSGINIFIDPPNQLESKIYNCFPQLRSELDWQWSQNYPQNTIWIKLRSIKELTNYFKEWKNLFKSAFQRKWD